MTKEKILQILKANYVYTKIAEKIADEIMELQEEKYKSIDEPTEGEIEVEKIPF